MRASLLIGCLVLGCAGKVDSATSGGDAAVIPDGGEGVPEVSPPTPEAGPIDVGPPIPTDCTSIDPSNPPIGCTPESMGASPCTSTAKVASCPTDTACMATVKQSLPRTTHRIGRLRLWKPDALLSLAPIAFDPNVNAKCANVGTEQFSWLLTVDRSANTLTTGSARASTDGRTFALVDQTLAPSALGSICPGFVGSSIRIAPVTTAISVTGTGFAAAPMAALNVAIYDAISDEFGVPIVLPLREVSIRVPSMPDPSCIGSWNPKYWCDGDTLGWTTGGAITAKISVEEADRVPIKSAGCQSLCAILVNDSTKTDGRVCKRGPDGKVPEIGNTCLGGASCKNAFTLSTTFGAYGVTATGP